MVLNGRFVLSEILAGYDAKWARAAAYCSDASPSHATRDFGYRLQSNTSLE
jgi:hypothetical protein